MAEHGAGHDRAADGEGQMKRIMIFDEPVRMQVLHPKYGVCEVVAYTPDDARMQAGNYWDMSYEEEKESKVAVETARLGEARYIEVHS